VTLTSPTSPSSPARTYADHVADYALAGWTCILPVPPATKTPPPSGFTGAEGRDTTPEQLVAWAGTNPGDSIALRMPWFPGDEILPGGWCVIGIDVDQYVKAGKQKHGAVTLAEHLERWGPLPATWSSTARGTSFGPGESRIMLFRAPARRYATRLVGTATGDVEIIQRHHRYAVVWPSFHQDANDGRGGLYRWYDPGGQAQERPPAPHELAWLPAEWVEQLAEGAAGASPASAGREVGQQLLDQLADDWRPECADLTSARLTALDAMSRADEGSRHDVMTERTYHLVQLAGSGHPGVAHALLEVRDAWARVTSGEDREEELERALLTAARKAVTTVGNVQVPRDPCTLFEGGRALPALAPGDPRLTNYQPVDEYGEPVDLQIYTPPSRGGFFRELIGAHTFDPVAGLDQPLADAVLERVYPAMRYAYDTRNWMLRAPDRWELREDLAPWAITEVAWRMPVGDPTAEKGSDQFERSRRRARFMTAAGAGAIAKMMRALVVAGTHPATVALADLDSDPEVLWAGGMPYSLRGSLNGPAFAQIDVSTPHLHTAGVMPEVRPTPLWDAFLAAVWPDVEIRRWAVRVLSIAFTGHADRALPILIGETGRGKTQLIHLLMSVLDTYGHAANPKLLAASSNEHDAMKYDLKGRRLSFIDEAPSDARSGQERLKQLTGGGSITGRQMGQNPVTFAPTHTLVLTANDPPHLVDPAVRSRVRLIPCDGDPEQVKAARAALGHVAGAAWRAEAPGVLARMMSEAAAWLADPTTSGLGAAPEHIRYLAEKIGAEQDPVAVWVTEETEPFEPGTPSRELYQAFTASCLRNNIRRDQIPSETKWGNQLTRLGYASHHTAHGKRRQLRVSSGGFLPGMEPLQTPTHSVDGTRQPTSQAMAPHSPVQPSTVPHADGFNSQADGLVTGSGAHPSSENVQVNPSVSVESDGLTGTKLPYAHEKSPESENADRVGSCREPVIPSVGEPALALASESVAEPVLELDPAPQPKPKSDKAVKARDTAAAKRAAARLEKIAAAAGRIVQLPALVTPDGAVHEAGLTDVDALLASISTAAYDGQGAGELTVDVETTGFWVGHRDFAMRTAQLGNEHFAVVLDTSRPDQLEVAGRHLRAAPVLHAHSATADLVPLALAGAIDLEEAWGRMDDTVVPAKLTDPAMTGSDPSLKKISATVLGAQALSPIAEEARGALFKAAGWLTEVKPTTPIEKSGWAQVDSRCETMVRYAAADVIDDAAIARRLPRIDPGLMDRERLAQRMTARIAAHGLRLDGEHVDELLAVHRPGLEDAGRRLREISGGRVENPGSDQQVAEAAAALGAQLPRTRTARLSVAKGAIEQYAELEGPLGDFVRARLDYQKAENALGLFLEPYRVLVEDGDGRARPTVYTLSADTGRMSCVRPNFQQLPQQGGFRACITADPGYLLIPVDFAQVELRVAAALSGDRGLQAILADPERDVHREIAQLVWGAGATKAHRYQAKRKVFGRIYGQAVAGMAASTPVVSLQVAQAVIDAMDALTPVLSEWSRMVRSSVQSGHTKFPTYSGRVVHLDPDQPHKAPNYCIQGTARELLIDGLVRWSQTRWGQCVLFPVHDELVVMVPEHEAAEASAALVECMTTELFGVPIVAEPNAPAFAWQDAA
jgi:hypothetical protein